MGEPFSIDERIAAYCRRRQLERLGPLGSGMHGHVFRAGPSAAAGEVALKVHLRREPFALELETYLRLRESRVEVVPKSTRKQFFSEGLSPRAALPEDRSCGLSSRLRVFA
jgi:hypothetical protein